MQNINSCYEPVKFTCPIENVLPVVFSITKIFRISNAILPKTLFKCMVPFHKSSHVFIAHGCE